MKTVSDYIKNHKYVLLLLYWPFHTLWFELLRIFTADKNVWLIETEFDKSIPFIEWFIIPYIIWYFYIAAVLIYSLYKSKREFLRSYALIFSCMFIPMLFCTVVPNGLPLSIRPDFELLGRENFAIDLVRFIYAADSPPRAVMPSMHCTVAVALFFAVLFSESLSVYRSPKYIAGALSAAIILSTVFIKQHSVADTVAGTCFGLIAAAAIRLIEHKIYRKRAITGI